MLQRYQSWDGEESENNDEWHNLDKFEPVIVGGKVTSVELNPLYDLTITLDNAISVHILIENGYSHYGEEREQYRFFEIGQDEETEEEERQRPHYVIYGKHIDIA